MKICSIEFCQEEVRSRGWCYKHYRRWIRHGDPLGGQSTYRVFGSPYERTMAHTEVGAPDECWPCQVESKIPFGHRYIKTDEGKVGAHVIVWKHHNGDLPSGHEIRHTCDNPPCVNPNHLLSGTRKDNVRDMHSRGRANPKRKLTDEQVAEIRDLAETGMMTQMEIAEIYEISDGYVSMIVNRLVRTS